MEERLQKVIAQSGYTSRRKAEELIQEGKVTVNGEVVTVLGTKVTKKDAICVNGKLINKEDKVDLYKDPLYRKIDDMYEEIMDGNFDYNILLDYLKKNDNIEKGVNYGRN